MKTPIKFGLYATALAIVIVAFVSWSNKHDAAMAKAMNVYETCVQAQYHTTPSAYYQEHGVTPECN